MKATTKSRRDNLRLSKRVNHTEYYSTCYVWTGKKGIYYLGKKISQLVGFRNVKTDVNRRVEVEND